MTETTDRLIVFLVVCLVLMAGVSFFVMPAYEKGVWASLGAIIAALSGVLGFRFGVTIPKQDVPKTEK